MSNTNYPVALDTWVNPNAGAGDTLGSVPHDTQHCKANDAIDALQRKVGIDGSTDASSIDKKLTLKQPLITTGSAPTAAAINSPTNAPTNYGAIAAILGTDANATNAKQNTTAANVNDLATKFNALVATLTAQGLLA